ncbi:MAG: protein translocase subunit SecF [bacterium]
MQFSIDFLKYRYFALTASVILLVAGVFGYFAKGGFKYNIDFSGGAEIRVVFQNPVAIDKFRAALSKQGWEDSVIQNIANSDKEYIVKVGITQLKDVGDLENKFSSDIKLEIPDNKMKVENIEWVGAEVGKGMQWAAIKAVLLSLLILLLYIAIRYKYNFAMGAVVALMHDILVVLVMILFLGEPISLNVLAAILAILGYSLNDTIVIYSRIRENLTKMHGVSLQKVVNTSLNQTLKRTLLTSFSTLLAVGSIFILGGETLHSFSLVMLLGIIFGTYSSIYIASPVMMLLGGVKEKAGN